MQLASVRPGDIVRVDKKGRVFLADVTGKDKGRLKIQPHSGNINYFEAGAREIICHWRKSGRKAVA